MLCDGRLVGSEYFATHPHPDKSEMSDLGRGEVPSAEDPRFDLGGSKVGVELSAKQRVEGELLGSRDGGRVARSTGLATIVVVIIMLSMV